MANIGNLPIGMEQQIPGPFHADGFDKFINAAAGLLNKSGA